MSGLTAVAALAVATARVEEQELWSAEWWSGIGAGALVLAFGVLLWGLLTFGFNLMRESWLRTTRLQGRTTRLEGELTRIRSVPSLHHDLIGEVKRVSSQVMHVLGGESLESGRFPVREQLARLDELSSHLREYEEVYNATTSFLHVADLVDETEDRKSRKTFVSVLKACYHDLTISCNKVTLGG